MERNAYIEFVAASMGAVKANRSISQTAGFPVYLRKTEPTLMLVFKDEVVEVYRDVDVFFGRYLDKRTPKGPRRGNSKSGE